MKVLREVRTKAIIITVFNVVKVYCYCGSYIQVVLVLVMSKREQAMSKKPYKPIIEVSKF